MPAVKGLQIHIRPDIGIVHQERFIPIQPGTCLPYASSRIQQQIALVTDVYIYTEVMTCLQKVDNLFTKVMDVHGQVCKASLFQFQNHPFQHRLAGYRHQCFGHSVGQRAQACTQPCCKYHGFHRRSSTCFKNLFDILFTMHQVHLYAKLLVQMLGQVLCRVDRAVLSARTAKAD